MCVVHLLIYNCYRGLGVHYTGTLQRVEDIFKTFSFLKSSENVSYIMWCDMMAFYPMCSALINITAIGELGVHYTGTLQRV